MCIELHFIMKMTITCNRSHVHTTISEKFLLILRTWSLPNCFFLYYMITSKLSIKALIWLTWRHSMFTDWSMVLTLAVSCYPTLEAHGWCRYWPDPMWPACVAETDLLYLSWSNDCHELSEFQGLVICTHIQVVQQICKSDI